jgi:hypothetical protein
MLWSFEPLPASGWDQMSYRATKDTSTGAGKSAASADVTILKKASAFYAREMK